MSEALARLRDRDTGAVLDALSLFNSANLKTRSRFAGSDTGPFLEAFPDASDRQRIRHAVDLLIEGEIRGFGVHDLDEAIRDLRTALHLDDTEGSALRRMAPKAPKRRKLTPKAYVVFSPNGKRFGWSDLRDEQLRGVITPFLGEPPFGIPRSALSWWVVLELRRSGTEEQFREAYELLMDEIGGLTHAVYGRSARMAYRPTKIWRVTRGRTKLLTALLFVRLGVNDRMGSSYAWPPLRDRLDGTNDAEIRQEWSQFEAVFTRLEEAGFDAKYALPAFMTKGSGAREASPRRLDLTGDQPLTLREARKLARWWHFEGWSSNLIKVGQDRFRVTALHTGAMTKGPHGSALRRIAPREPEKPRNRIERPYPFFFELANGQKVPWIEFDVLHTAAPGEPWREGSPTLFLNHDVLVRDLQSQTVLSRVGRQVLLLGWRVDHAGGGWHRPDRGRAVSLTVAPLLWREGTLYEAEPFLNENTRDWKPRKPIPWNLRLARLESLGSIILRSDALKTTQRRVEVEDIAWGALSASPVTLRHPTGLPFEFFQGGSVTLLPEELRVLWKKIREERDAHVQAGLGK